MIATPQIMVVREERTYRFTDTACGINLVADVTAQQDVVHQDGSRGFSAPTVVRVGTTLLPIASVLQLADWLRTAPWKEATGR